MSTAFNHYRRRAERVEQWANLHGDELENTPRGETFLLDDEARLIFEEALFCARDLLLLLPIVEKAER